VGETRRCKALKAGGGRCTATAQQGSEWCWGHDPDRAEERKKNASLGGKTRSRRPPDELEGVKRQVRALIKSVLNGSLDRANGAVALQGYNILLRTVEIQRKLDGQRELEESVAGLREQLEEVKRNRWAAT
jgi:hypothetical protein